MPGLCLRWRHKLKDSFKWSKYETELISIWLRGASSPSIRTYLAIRLLPMSLNFQKNCSENRTDFLSWFRFEHAALSFDASRRTLSRFQFSGHALLVLADGGFGRFLLFYSSELNFNRFSFILLTQRLCQNLILVVDWVGARLVFDAGSLLWCGSSGRVTGR